MDHPLVLMPAELQLASDGALVVSMASAAQAALWNFPGIPAAAPAVLQLDKCARDNRLIGTHDPPPPTERLAWSPLLERAAHCLASDSEYVDEPPKVRLGSAVTRSAAQDCTCKAV